jgi:hypothetical protein
MMTPKQLTGEIQRRLDGPHDDDHTAAAADLAAECIRFLNYATGSHSPAGMVYPSTAYLIAADLSSAAHRMVQLFGQLADWLAREDAAGMLGTDDGRPTADVVAIARMHLFDAASRADRLSACLAGVQNDLGAVNGRGPGRQIGGA